MIRTTPTTTILKELAALAPVAVLGIAGTAAGQSLVGDTFDYEAIGTRLNNVMGSATVGPGPEFVLTGPDGSFAVDVEATRITITIDTPFIFGVSWGQLFGEVRGSLTISGLRFSGGNEIASISASGLQLTPGDVTLTGETITIGATSGDNFLPWQQGSKLVIDLVPDAIPGPNATILRTGESFITIAGALAAAQIGDTVQLTEGVFFEQGLQLDGVTLRGIGSGRTIIDGEGIPGSVISVPDLGDPAPEAIESLTIRNGAGAPSEAAAITVRRGGDLVIRDCVIEDNAAVTFPNGNLVGGPVGGLLFIESNARIESTVFRANTTFDVIDIQNVRSVLTAVNCVFEDTASQSAPQIDTRGSSGIPAVSRLVNCTLFGAETGVRTLADADTVLENCVIDSVNRPLAAQLGYYTVSNSVFERRGTTFIDLGGNIDAAPIFVDAAGGDLRLAASSPGIDAADFNAYASGGGGSADVAGGDRAIDASGAPNAGAGAIRFLDAGAFEFKGSSGSPDPDCAADFNGDLNVDFFDVVEFLDAVDTGCE